MSDSGSSRRNDGSCGVSHIADNIGFFDSHFDKDRMIACARVTRVHDKIMAMPTGYSSLIRGMDNSLSDGRKQRVLLARPRYKRPRILFLDEGAAHLNVAEEKEINERLRQLSITRISVAHRPEMGSRSYGVKR
jgi:ATP-binding cassette subfamily B protein RaxB